MLERHSATVLARELDLLEGTWAQALLRGCTRIPAHAPHKLAAQAEDPPLLVANVVADLDKALKDSRFVWTYVNVGDHVRRHGYDESVHEAMLRLDAHASRWAAQGWTVVAHSDHGMVPVDPDPELVEAWDAIVREECVIPSGGAGRTRWLYPKADRLEVVFDRVATTLGDTATVHHATDLGLPQPEARPGRRGGRVAEVPAPGSVRPLRERRPEPRRDRRPLRGLASRTVTVCTSNSPTP